MPLLALCYLIPSVQMVFSMQSMARELGSEEQVRSSRSQPLQLSLQCYLNFGCSRPWWIFSDINHIISNAGYIIYGITFIVLVSALYSVQNNIDTTLTCQVRLKSWMLPSENRTDTDHQGRLGLPQQHSIFYTLGLAMVLQVVVLGTEGPLCSKGRNSDIYASIPTHLDSLQTTLNEQPSN